MTMIHEAQSEIDPKRVALMIIQFWDEFHDVYGNDVIDSSLCAVGPLQAMIGLAIKNGHLAVVKNNKEENESA